MSSLPPMETLSLVDEGSSPSVSSSLSLVDEGSSPSMSSSERGIVSEIASDTQPDSVSRSVSESVSGLQPLPHPVTESHRRSHDFLSTPRAVFLNQPPSTRPRATTGSFSFSGLASTTTPSSQELGRGRNVFGGDLMPTLHNNTTSNGDTSNSIIGSSNNVFTFGEIPTIDFTFRTIRAHTPQPTPEPSPQMFATRRSLTPSPDTIATHRTVPASPSPSFRLRSRSVSRQRTPSIRGSFSFTPVVPFFSIVPPVPTVPAVSATPATLAAPATPDAVVVPAESVIHVARTTSHVPGTPAVVRVPPYHPIDEAPPEHPLFSPAIESALRKTTRKLKTASRLMNTINNMDDGGESRVDLQRLMAEAKDLEVFHSTTTCNIAVLGKTAAGKSHLINSLLHVKELAPTGDNGSACTFVATEYRQKRPEHTANFTVEVEYLSASAIQEHLRALLWRYRRKFLCSDEDKDTPYDDYCRLEMESAQAKAALATAFGHEPEFAKLLDVDIGMSLDGNDTFTQILDTLVAWAKRIEWPAGSVDGMCTWTAGDAKTCREAMRRFTEDRIWPFTKIIRVYLDAQVLASGVVLADLPGLDDMNLARVRATLDYLIRCNNILIVEDINRAITSSSLRSSVFRVLSRHMPTEWHKMRIVVVCTKTDLINVRTSKDYFSTEQHAADLNPTELERLDREITTAREAGNTATEEARQFEQKLLLVRARNMHVSRSLQENYDGIKRDMDSQNQNQNQSQNQNAGHDRPLDVFCVSNWWYEDYAPRGNAAMVEASQIPALRRYCHAIVADAQLRETKNYLLTSVPAFFTSLNLWVSSAVRRQSPAVPEAPVMDVAAVQGKAAELKDKMLDLTVDFEYAVSDEFDSQILTTFLDKEERQRHWTESAITQGKKWLERDRSKTDYWHPSQYHAWCLHNGDHETDRKKGTNWNALLIWKMRNELAMAWDIFAEQVPVFVQNVLDGASVLLASLQEAIREASSFEAGVDSSGAVLAELVDFKLAKLVKCLDILEQRFLREIEVIRNYTCEPNSSSYIVREMQPHYERAAARKYNGRTRLQERDVQGHIERGRIFRNIQHALEKDIDHQIHNAKAQLHNHLMEVLTGIGHDIDVFAARFLQRQQADQEAQRSATLEEKLSDFSDEVEGLRERHKCVVDAIRNL